MAPDLIKGELYTEVAATDPSVAHRPGQVRRDGADGALFSWVRTIPSSSLWYPNTPN